MPSGRDVRLLQARLSVSIDVLFAEACAAARGTSLMERPMRAWFVLGKVMRARYEPSWYEASGRLTAPRTAGGCVLVCSMERLVTLNTEEVRPKFSTDTAGRDTARPHAGASRRLQAADSRVNPRRHQASSVQFASTDSALGSLLPKFGTSHKDKLRMRHVTGARTLNAHGALGLVALWLLGLGVDIAPVSAPVPMPDVGSDQTRPRRRASRRSQIRAASSRSGPA